MLLLVFSLVSFHFTSFMRRPSAVPSSATGWSSTLPSSNPSTRPFPESRPSTNPPVGGLPADLVAPVALTHLGSPPPRSRATASPRTGCAPRARAVEVAGSAPFGRTCLSQRESSSGGPIHVVGLAASSPT
ncbi:hypothetical protein PF010_g33325, partial [Phytophthora fragariae]